MLAVRHLGLAVALGLAPGLPGCETCNRDGCDALQARAPDVGSRIAGIVASESDAVSNGCQECGFGGGTRVSAWSVEHAATNDAELASATHGPETAADTTSDSGQYAIALSPGSFVVCFANSCFNARVSPAHTTTLNVRLINGISRGFLFEEGSAPNQLDAIFRPPS